MSGRYKRFSYEITGDPEFLNKKSGITPDLFRQMEDLHHRASKGGDKNIQKLISMIEKYPRVPQLKNYLSVAYVNSGNPAKANEVNHWIIREHPDYLFGRLNLAFEYLYKKQYDKIPEVVGNLMEIKDMYPERNCFHLSEITSFNKFAIMYFCAVGNMEAAESRYEIMEELAPGHPDTIEVFPYLLKARLEKATKRMEEEERTRISVSTTRPACIQRKEEPEFNHSEITWLYENGMAIDREKLKTILSLPYESLVSDLTLVLKDTIYRYEYFRKITKKKKKWQEERMSFPLHAIYLLGELRAEESLSVVLETLRQGEEFLEFWYGDFLTGELWEPLFHIGRNRLDLLKDLVLSPHIYAFARSEVASCTSQIALHHPERRQEVVEWFRDIFSSLGKASLDDGLIDSDFLGLAISDALDIRAKELLPEIKRLFELGYVNKGICGDYEKVEKEIRSPGKKLFKKNLLNIFDRYQKIVTTWNGYEDEEKTKGDKNDNLPAGPKAGRNDPCPCGSGKKYKKCCMKKDE